MQLLITPLAAYDLEEIGDYIAQDNPVRAGSFVAELRAIFLKSCYDLLMAPTVFRQGAFRFFFFSREEPRMHIHVSHNDGEAKLWLKPQIELAMNQGLSQKQIGEVLSLVQLHYEEISDAWHIHFGS